MAPNKQIIETLAKEVVEKNFAGVIHLIETDWTLQLNCIKSDYDIEVFAFAAVAYYEVGDFNRVVKLSTQAIDYLTAHYDPKHSFDLLNNLFVTRHNACIKASRFFKAFVLLNEAETTIGLSHFPVLRRLHQDGLEFLTARIKKRTTTFFLVWAILLWVGHGVFGWIQISYYFPLLIVSLIAAVIIFFNENLYKRIVQWILQRL